MRFTWSQAKVVLLLGPAWLCCSGCDAKKEALAPPLPPEVEFVTVEQKDVPIHKEWVGTLEGDINASISAQVSGYLTNRAYAEGSRVKSSC
jgi:membrane fusion protein (multidrug efflux system)